MKRLPQEFRQALNTVSGILTRQAKGAFRAEQVARCPCEAGGGVVCVITQEHWEAPEAERGREEDLL